MNNFRRHSGAMRQHRTRNLEIPGSLALLAPRNDGANQLPAFSALSISVLSTVLMLSGVTGPTNL